MPTNQFLDDLKRLATLFDDGGRFEISNLFSIEEITKLDPSINEIYHLQYGWRAWRIKKEDEWEYAEDVEEDYSE